MEQEFIWRLQYGAGPLRPPSDAYTLRLLSYHYKGCKSLRSKTDLVARIRHLVHIALKQAQQRIDNPTAWDYECDPDLSVLTDPYNRLVYANQWVEMCERELKAVRFQPKDPSIKVVVLAYRLLLEAGELPPHLKAPNRALAQFIAEQQREKKQKGTSRTIYNYLICRNTESRCFINTKANHDAARAWIEEYWPKADVAKVRSLPNMQ